MKQAGLRVGGKEAVSPNGRGNRKLIFYLKHGQNVPGSREEITERIRDFVRESERRLAGKEDAEARSLLIEKFAGKIFDVAKATREIEFVYSFLRGMRGKGIESEVLEKAGRMLELEFGAHMNAREKELHKILEVLSSVQDKFRYRRRSRIFSGKVRDAISVNMHANQIADIAMGGGGEAKSEFVDNFLRKALIWKKNEVHNWMEIYRLIFGKTAENAAPGEKLRCEGIIRLFEFVLEGETARRTAEYVRDIIKQKEKIVKQKEDVLFPDSAEFKRAEGAV